MTPLRHRNKIEIASLFFIFILFFPISAFAKVDDPCIAEDGCEANERCELTVTPEDTPCLAHEQCQQVHGAQAKCILPEDCDDPLSCPQLRKCVIVEGTCQIAATPATVNTGGPLEVKKPDLQIDIPSLTAFADVSTQKDENGSEFATFPWIGQYIKAIYLYFLGIAGLIAVIMLIHAGFEWMASGGNTKTVEKAKTRMRNVSIGAVILFGSYTILNVINPDLVKFKGIRIQILKRVPIEFEEILDDNLGSGGNPISGLLGEFDQAAGGSQPCTPEAANLVAQKLHDIQICVGPCHCAYTASHFLNYIGCTNIYNGNASGLALALEQSGWIAQKLTSSNPPLGLLFQPGHVGVSLGGGQQFQSGGGNWFKKAKGAGNCPAKFDEVQGDECSYCGKILDQSPQSKRFGGAKFGGIGGAGDCRSNQGWAKGKVSQSNFKIVISPPGQAIIASTVKDRCKNKKGEVKDRQMSQALCEAFEGTWLGPGAQSADAYEGAVYGP